MDDILVRGTVQLAMLLYLVCLVRWIVSPAVTSEQEKPLPAQRITWTIGCLIFLAHVAAAFHYRHDWSHQLAYQFTARDTLETVGIEFGAGIYFSYTFALLWCLDVVWMWIGPASHRQRPSWSWILLHGYLMAIAANGAVVFASGPTRWIGAPALLLLAVLLIVRLRRPHGLTA